MGTVWERLAVLEGGTVVGLATAMTAEGVPVAFAATPFGAFRSTAAGRIWEPLGAPGSVPGVEIVLPSPRYAQDGIVYAGAHDGLHRWSSGQWQHLLTGSRVLALACLAGDGPDPRLLAGTEDDGVLVSHDGGRTWTGANPGLLDLTILALALSPAFERDGLGFAATPSGLYRTRNGAESWRAVDIGGDDVAIQCLALSPSFERDRLILAGTEEQGLLRSEDGGRSWETVTDLANCGVNGIAFSDHGLVVAATDSGVALSQDGGTTWQHTGGDLGSALCAAVLPNGDERVLLAGLPDGGVTRSVDLGQYWAAANAGLAANLLASLAISPAFATDATLFVAGAQAGILGSKDGGRTWSARNSGIEGRAVFQVAISPEYACDGTLFAVTDGGLYVSRSRAERWAPVPSLPAPSLPAPSLPPVEDGQAAAPDSSALPARLVAVTAGTHDHTAGSPGNVTVLAALLDGRLAVSGNGSLTWRSFDTPFGTADVVALAPSPTFARDGTLYAATAGPTSDEGGREIVVWRTMDDGQRWERWLEERGAPPVCLVALPSNPSGDTLAVGLGGRVLRPRQDASEVRGGRRRPLWRSTGLPGSSTILAGLGASPDFRRDRTLFAATSAGVYVSCDGGATFSTWPDGPALPSTVTVVPSPAYAEDGVVYALGLGGTIWRRRDG
ncbi:MAG: hypothetical protein IT305_06710 [Chloroflexi bacterium]|nr:hypothetical protein [Chloroflexota bacterium]